MVTYLRVLATLQLEDDLSLIAKEDRLGRSLQDLDLPHGRTPRSKKSSVRLERHTLLLNEQ